MIWIWFLAPMIWASDTAELSSNAPCFYDLDAVSEDEKHFRLEIRQHDFEFNEHLKRENPRIYVEFRRRYLDGPIRQSVFLLESMESLRDELFPKGLKRNFPLLKYRFELYVRNLRGENQESLAYNAYVFLSPKRGMGGIATKRGGERLFRIEDLRLKEAQEAFMLDFFRPMVITRYTWPDQGRFLVDLFFWLPQQHAKSRKIKHPDVYRSPVFLGDSMVINNRRQLGAAYVSRDDGDILVGNSGQLHHFHEASVHLADFYAQKETDPDAAFAAIEAYHTMMPADPRGFQDWMKGLIARDRMNRALQMADRMSLLLKDAPEVLEPIQDFKDQIQKRRDDLYAERAKFNRSSQTQVEILSPTDRQMIGGQDELVFRFSGNQAPLLKADLLLADERLASIERPPWRIPLKFDPQDPVQTLTLRLFFEDRTYQQDDVIVRVIPIDAQENVKLKRLRAVVTRGHSQHVLNLRKENFILREEGELRAIRDLHLERSPIRVAILIDTSGSMEQRLRAQAQYAVYAFLSQFEAEDQAQIYTFNQTVVRMSPMTHDVEALMPDLFTLNPMFKTRLHDAIYLAHQDLLQFEGTQVMVILSDGQDTGSFLQQPQIIDLIKDSPVMVYSVVYGDEHLTSSEQEGVDFLNKLASLTGSATLLVKPHEELEAAYQQIYNELKSFYYMDFYSRLEELDMEKVDLQTIWPGYDVRFRKLNR